MRCQPPLPLVRGALAVLCRCGYGSVLPGAGAAAVAPRGAAAVTSSSGSSDAREALPPRHARVPALPPQLGGGSVCRVSCRDSPPGTGNSKADAAPDASQGSGSASASPVLKLSLARSGLCGSP